MKKGLLFSLLATFLCAPLSAQLLIDDFESNPHTWTSVACGSGIVDNPYAEGLNPSCKVLSITRVPACDNWSGAMYTPASPLTGYRYVHCLMYRNNAHQPNLKVYDPTDGGNSADIAPLTPVVPNQWQDVVFDVQDHAINFLFLMVDRTDLTADAVLYVDDILLSNDPAPRTTPSAACSDTPIVPNPPVESGDYTLVWNADFTQTALPTAAWNIETNGDGGGNNELQYYCDRGVSLAQEPLTGKHCLVLTATKESFGGKDFTSGRVNTMGNVYFQYGKIEARIYFPNTANGLWPAFWMMGNDMNTGTVWPACGETDIVELGHANGIRQSTQDRFFNGASHWGPSWDAHYQYAQDRTNAYSVEDGFHTFTCIWDADHVAMYLDLDRYPSASPYYQMTIPLSTALDAPGTYFHKPNFILLNLAVGGNFPSIWNADGITALANGPRSMYVDYVRIYQKGDAGEFFYAATPSDPLEEPASSAVESVTVAPTVRKVLYQGQLYLLKDGKVYNAMGQLVDAQK